ncbi:hypothetical protein BDV36DRAFT_293222 [Aspergillus pseudocaelatus]|uniref:Transcription factor domain-containing protein n=1 Tax=Aspergillus pseudocaelatus TaxID=1825620 RepID=A0ABQ6WTY9_9EURO|nr:hypothetical protein BDV36DRAFT_293222 [Aspergillus pseudocaelatus]
MKKKRGSTTRAAARQDRDKDSYSDNCYIGSPTDSVPAYGDDSASPAEDAFSSGVRRSLLSAHLRNPADALNLLTVTAEGYKECEGGPSTPVAFQPEHTQTTHFDSTLDPIRGLPADASSCSNFLLIRKGIVQLNELFEYIEFFFSRLWPIRPVIPLCYQHQSTHASLVMEEPLLTICLVTIASRYHPLSGAHGEIRSERVHWKVWKILQRLLQSALWGTTATRSLGTISAMLLLIEWHVKAINNPTDFADDDIAGFGDEYRGPSGANSGGSSSSFGYPNYRATTSMEKRNIVAPAYRSNKMSWMLLSNAIALAHEGHCFQEGVHVPNHSSASEVIKQEWNRLICVFLYFADEHLSTRMGLESLLPDQSRAIVQDRLALNFASSLPNNTAWEDYFELTVITRKAREFIHSTRQIDYTSGFSELLPHLKSLDRGLSRWKIQHSYHQHDPGDFLNACIEMEYNYTLMYSFAPASHASYSFDTNHPTTAPHKEAPTILSHYTQQATQASYDLLSIAVGVLHPAGLLPYLPVRCWLFIVAASLYLLRATLSKDKLVSSSHPNARLLVAAIDAIREGSPDDTHMAVRYFKFLERLVRSSITPSPHTTEHGQVVHHDMNKSVVSPPSGGHMRAADSDFMTSIEIAELGDFPAPLNQYFTDLLSMGPMHVEGGL